MEDEEIAAIRARLDAWQTERTAWAWHAIEANAPADLQRCLDVIEALEERSEFLRTRGDDWEARYVAADDRAEKLEARIRELVEEKEELEYQLNRVLQDSSG